MKIDSIPFRKIIVYLIYVLLIPSIQVIIMPKLSIFGQIADLMLVFVVLSGFMFGFYDGIIVGLIVGFIRDLLASPIIPGPDNTLSISIGLGILVLFFAGVYGSVFFEGRTNRNFALALLAVLTFSIIYKLAGNLTIYVWESFIASMDTEVDLALVLRDSVLVSTILNCLAAVPMYFLLRYLGPVRWSPKNKEKNKELTYGDSGKWLTI